jgi:putative transposase
MLEGGNACQRFSFLAFVELMFPWRSSVQDYFYSWSCRGVLDCQSLKIMESGGPRGFNAGKKTKGRKRHIVTDTQGNWLQIQVHPADAQDRGGAVELIAVLGSLHPWLRHLFANGDYAGEKRQTALAAHGKWKIEVAKRSPGTKGFEVLPPAMGVQRTLAWLKRCGRLAKDAEATVTRAKPMRVEPTFIDFALTA